MSDARSPSGPLDVVGVTVDAAATEAFGLLANEIRLATLLALWESYDPTKTEGAISFSELRRKVGNPDSGQFNYHLGQLEGQFVEATDDGHKLTPEGLKLVQTIIAGTGRGGTFEPTEIDMECYHCGAPAAITYEKGRLFLICTECEGHFADRDEFPEGALVSQPFPPAALEGREPEEIFAAGVFRLLQIVEMKLGGVCPRCAGVVSSSLQICDSHEPGDRSACSTCGHHANPRLKWICSTCKYEGSGSPGATVILHPAVVSFYHRHGIGIGYNINDVETASAVLELMANHEQELIARDPPRIQVTLEHNGDKLTLILDDSLAVLDSTWN